MNLLKIFKKRIVLSKDTTANQLGIRTDLGITGFQFRFITDGRVYILGHQWIKENNTSTKIILSNYFNPWSTTPTYKQLATKCKNPFVRLIR